VYLLGPLYRSRKQDRNRARRPFKAETAPARKGREMHISRLLADHEEVSP
jgi:hypothetical protein